MKHKFSIAFSLAVILALVLATGVFADDIANQLDSTVDATAEVLSLQVGGSTGNVGLYEIQVNGDGKNGCNLTGSTTLVVSVNSSNQSVATVSPSQITFGSCGDIKNITVTPVGPGTSTVTLQLVSNSTGGSFNLAPATFTVNVIAPTNTPPSVNVTGVVNGGVYALGSVPAAGCSVTDAEDGNPTFAATLSDVTGAYSVYGLGSQTASCLYTDGGGLTASASATYSIVDKGLPVLANMPTSFEYEGNTTGGANVPFGKPSATDAIDPAPEVVCTPVSESFFALGGPHEIKCTAIDFSGNQASETFNITVVDTTNPIISLISRLPGGNSYDWNNQAVTVTWGCSDIVGVVNSSVSQTVSIEGENQSVTGTCVDTSGNTAKDTQDGISIDLTKPTILAAATTEPNSYDWYKSDVDVEFSCDDDLSGIADGACPAVQTLSDEGSNIESLAKTVIDKAGNGSEESNVIAAKIDKTKPTLTWTGGPADGSSFYFGFGPGAPTCSAVDGLSGPKSCDVTGYVTTVGNHTLTAIASDLAGNEYQETRHYTVLAYDFKGFYQPVDMPNTWNLVKNGSTVPFKFEIFAGSTELTSTSYVESFKVTTVPCTVASLIADPVEFTTTGATSLRYDLSGGQFINNWQTPKNTGCVQVTLKTIDGVSHFALFRLK